MKKKEEKDGGSIKYVSIDGRLYKRTEITKKVYLNEKKSGGSRLLSFVSKYSKKNGKYIYYKYSSMIETFAFM